LNDPHVISLTYTVTAPETVRFDDAPSLVCNTSQRKLTLENGLLIIEPETHFGSEESARIGTERFLRAWEIDAALRQGQNEIAFLFKVAQTVDRAPSKSSDRILDAKAILAGTSIGKATATVHRKKYPEPPALFEFTPDVEALWNRYQGNLEGHEPLLSMAYFCLTVLEYFICKSRKSFAKQYKVSKDLLDMLGKLCSTRGDAMTARKIIKTKTPKVPLIALTVQENEWVEAAIKILIRRVGESAHIDSLPEITMASLPPLSP
jgi:hypothetical protein